MMIDLTTLNEACDDIADAAGLPETGTRDALNLLVNAAMHYTQHPGASLADVVAECYSIDETELDVVLGWIDE